MESRKPEQSMQQNRNDSLKEFDKLVGIWTVSGKEVLGQVSFEWMEGGFFLKQSIYLQHLGQRIVGLEIIGFEKKFGELESSQEIKSRFFDNQGNTLDYVYEIEKEFITIWAGEKNSLAFYKGRFSKDRNSVEGEWVWPGGGYKSIMTRISKYSRAL